MEAAANEPPPPGGVMLERVDRVQLVVRDRQAAARTFGEVLGAQPVREAPMTAGFSARDMAALKSNVEPSETLGMRVVIAPDAARP